MANSEKVKAVAEPVKKAPVAQPKVNESVYTAEELAQNHKFFKTSYEIVSVALQLAGKTAATITEAKNIIEKFKNREVK